MVVTTNIQLDDIYNVSRNVSCQDLISYRLAI